MPLLSTFKNLAFFKKIFTFAMHKKLLEGTLMNRPKMGKFDLPSQHTII